MKKVLLLAPMGSIHTRFNLANIEAIRQLGYQLTIVANFEAIDGPEKNNALRSKEWQEEGFKVISFPFVRHSLIGNIRLIPKLRELLIGGEYEIIHTHTETGGLLLRLCGKVPSKKIYTIHGMSFWKGGPLKNRLLYKPVERFICAGMDVNLGMNKEEFFYLCKWNEKSAEFVHGIGLNLQRFDTSTKLRKEVRASLGIPSDSMLLMSVGELDDNKNHAAAIKALGLLGRKDIYYIICGVGPNKDMLEILADDVGLKKNVKLLGFQSDIPSLLHASDIFIFPSFHEGMPVSVLESMAAGLPVICSEIRGNVDIVTEGENGYLFAPDDIKSLAAKIRLLIDDKETQIAMGQKNKEIVKAFSMDAVVEELKQIYSK